MLCLVFIVSCNKHEKCTDHKKSKCVLVAYRVAKHSHFWLKRLDTGLYHNVGGLGGRRIPIMNLGDTIIVEFCKNEIIIDGSDYSVYPQNTQTRFVCIEGQGYDQLINF